MARLNIFKDAETIQEVANFMQKETRSVSCYKTEGLDVTVY